MASEHPFVEVERREGFAIVSFNRPERKNALVPGLAEFLRYGNEGA